MSSRKGVFCVLAAFGRSIWTSGSSPPPTGTSNMRSCRVTSARTFSRLNVVTIPLPGLSERRDDIPLLVGHFIEKYCLAFRKKVTGIQPQALQILMSYTFPGNVRELENI